MALVFSGGLKPALETLDELTFWWSFSLMVRRRLSNNLSRRDLACTFHHLSIVELKAQHLADLAMRPGEKCEPVASSLLVRGSPTTGCGSVPGVTFLSDRFHVVGGRAGPRHDGSLKELEILNS